MLNQSFISKDIISKHKYNGKMLKNIINKIEAHWRINEYQKLVCMVKRDYPKKLNYFLEKEVSFIINKKNIEGKKLSEILKEGINKGLIPKTRSIADLKNKLNIILKKTSYYITKSRYWMILAINDNLIKTLLKRTIIIKEKFPYDAVERFLNQNEIFFKEFRITVVDLNVSGKYHYYYVKAVDNDKYKIRKLNCQRKL